MNTPAPQASQPDDRRQDRKLEEQRRALVDKARELGATAEELEAALHNLALQAEAVLHRLRGGRIH